MGILARRFSDNYGGRGRGVSELCTAFSHSIEMGARLEDAADTIHAHPTLGEAVQEAALRALGQALHLRLGHVQPTRPARICRSR